MIDVDRFSGTDQQKFDQAIAAARHGSLHRPVTLAFAEREKAYVFHRPLLIPGHVSVVSRGDGKRSTVWVFRGNGIKRGDTLVTWDRPFGGTWSGIRVAAGAGMKDHREITGLRTLGARSCKLYNFEIAMGSFGRDSVGLRIDRSDSHASDSTVVTDFNIQASTCVKGLVGDNIFLSYFDLTCLDNHDRQVGAGIHHLSPGWNVVCREGTIQKGDYAYYNRTDANEPGNVLRLQDIRYEQGRDLGQPAWVMDVTRQRNNGERWWGQETFIIDGCRNSKRQYGTDFRGARSLRVQCGGEDGYRDLWGRRVDRSHDDPAMRASSSSTVPPLTQSEGDELGPQR